MRAQTAFAVIILTLMYDPAYSSQDCSAEERCLCSNLLDGSIKADCSNLNLTSVPQLFGNITVVDLSCNELPVFYNNGEIPNSILRLNLSNNTISRFTKDAFKDFPHLEELNLRHNNLSYENDVFERDIFRNLKKLKILNLQHNIQKMALEYPDAIAQIDSLKVLKLDGIKFPKFNSSFQYLRNLQNLTLSGDSGHCYIEGLPSDTFLNTPFITFLDLSFCDIRYIENGTFKNLSGLQHLNVSHNKHLTFKVLANVSHDLQFTAIDVLDFSKIHCTYGPGTYLYGDDMEHLKKTKLREVYLDSNRLVITDVASVLNVPKSLKKLSLGDNRLTMGEYIFFVQSLYNLETFDANDQYKSHTPTPDTNRLKICFDWRGPYEAVDQNSYQDMFSLHRHSMQRNDGFGFVNFEYYSRWINFPSESVLPEIPLPPNLSTARFESGNLKYPIPEMTFSRNNSVSHLYLHDNILHSWEGPLYNLHRLLHVDLSQNFCSNLSSVFFSDCVNLQFLNISNNLLGFTFNVRADFHPFVNLSNLRTLDASVNRIERLSKKVFGSLKNLNILDLHSNSLAQWNFTIRHIKKLRYIDLSGNHLTTIPRSIRDELSDLALNNNSLNINLRGNSFRCDCSDSSQAFINWMSDMQKRYQLFKKFNQYTCTAYDDTTIVFSSLDDYIIRQKRECGFHLGLIVGALGAVLVSVLCIVGG